jgi:hypothetical protein
MLKDKPNFEQLKQNFERIMIPNKVYGLLVPFV